MKEQKVVLSGEPSKVPQRTKKVPKMKTRTKNGSNYMIFGSIKNVCWLFRFLEPFQAVQKRKSLLNLQNWFKEIIQAKSFFIQLKIVLNPHLYHILGTNFGSIFYFGTVLVLKGTFEGPSERKILEPLFLRVLNWYSFYSNDISALSNY